VTVPSELQIYLIIKWFSGIPKMATQMGFLSYGVILTLAVLTVLLPILTTGNVIDQRVLQRELGENSPEIMSMSDKDDFRDIEEPVVDDYTIKTKVFNLINNCTTLNISLLTFNRILKSSQNPLRSLVLGTIF